MKARKPRSEADETEAGALRSALLSDDAGIRALRRGKRVADTTREHTAVNAPKPSGPAVPDVRSRHVSRVREGATWPLRAGGGQPRTA